MIFGGPREGGTPKPCPGIGLFIDHPSLSRQKSDVFLVHLGVLGGWHPQIMSK